LVAAWLAIIGTQSLPRAQDNPDKAHRQWLEARYTEATSIKAGMTRADLLKLFWEEGGFQGGKLGVGSQRFALKSCNLIHVDVTFDKDDVANRRPPDSVRIIDVSTPYLGRIVLD
jgi:hypothetical protein